jgi:hypothetical protein
VNEVQGAGFKVQGFRGSGFKGIAVRLRKFVSVHGVLKLCRNEVMSLEIL